MDFNELLHKLEGVRVANRQLVEKLEQAQNECAAYKEFQNVEGNLDSTANKFCVLGNPCRIYTMSFVNDQDTIKGALDVLNVYDGDDTAAIMKVITPDTVLQSEIERAEAALASLHDAIKLAKQA